jgi:hypothetical protein
MRLRHRTLYPSIPALGVLRDRGGWLAGAQRYNPYTPDAGARPPALVGRDRELKHLQSIIAQLGAGGTSATC